VKILALSDTHIGAGYEHRKDALADTSAVLDQIADLAVERRVDLVLHAGDVFHRAKPAPAELHVFKHFCDRLAAPGIPMIAIGGNGLHEAPAGQKSALELFEGPLVRVSRTPEILNYAGVTVCTLPATSLGRLATEQRSGDRADLAEQAVDLLLASARDLFAQAPTDRPRILLAHQMVSGASLPNGLPLEALGAVLPLWALEEIGYDALVLGDIHKPQDLTSTIFYCGSPMTMDFGEAEVRHGCYILEVEGDAQASSTTTEFVPLSDRRFITVDVDLGDFEYAVSDLDETDWIAAAISEALL
jgi:exonuclease SbcD